MNVFAPDDLMDIPIDELATMVNRRRGHLKRMKENNMPLSDIERQEQMVKAAEVAFRSRTNDVLEYFVLMSLNELRDDV